MNNAAKKSLKLPLFLIIGPTIILALVIFLQAMTEPEILKPTGDGYVDHMNFRTYEDSFDRLPIFERSTRILLSLVSWASLVGLAPCFILGVIILSNRKNSTL